MLVCLIVKDKNHDEVGKTWQLKTQNDLNVLLTTIGNKVSVDRYILPSEYIVNRTDLQS